MMEGMRSLSLIVVIAGLLGAQAALGAGAAKPQVRIADASPFTVTGTGFPAQERVTVTVTGKGLRLSKAVMSTTTGRFTASWTRVVTVGGCNHGAIAAVAADGTKALWKAPPAVCGAPPVDP